MRTRFLISASLVMTLLVVTWVLLSSNGRSRSKAMQKEEARLASEVESLQSENEKLREKALLLRGDAPGSTAYLKKIAREELGYIGEDERLLLIDDVERID